MKNALILLLLLAMPLVGFSSGLKILTWNICYNNPGDGINAWPNRKEKVITLLKEVKPSIFCLQETLDAQVNDVARALPGYAWAGVGGILTVSGGWYPGVVY